MYKAFLRKLIASVTLVAFVLSSVPSSYAQSALNLPAPGNMVGLSASADPVMLRGIKVDPKDPLNINFILDKGNDASAQNELSRKAEVPVRDFLAALTVPENDLWVNLSPYEKDRIIPDAFSLTEMGRSFLEQDYLLKQLTASMLHPDSDLGKRFWAKVYADAYQRYGTTDVPLDTFNKVWIAPETATVYENDQAAFVIEAKFKVMMEEDYLLLKEHRGIESAPAGNEEQPLSGIGRDALRTVIIPALEKEVNEGESFGRLRQIYHSLLLGLWFKRKLQGSVLDREYFGRNKVEGISSHDPKFSSQVYQTYLEAFRKGVYNFVREETDRMSGEVLPRKYFSGGLNLIDHAEKTTFTKATDRLAKFAKTVFLALAITTSVAVSSQDVMPDTLPGLETTLKTVQKAWPTPWRYQGRPLNMDSLGLAGVLDITEGSPWVSRVDFRPVKGWSSYSGGKIIIRYGDQANKQGIPFRSPTRYLPTEMFGVIMHEFAHSWGSDVNWEIMYLFEQALEGDGPGQALLEQVKIYFGVIDGLGLESFREYMLHPSAPLGMEIAEKLKEMPRFHNDQRKGLIGRLQKGELLNESDRKWIMDLYLVEVSETRYSPSEEFKAFFIHVLTETLVSREVGGASEARRAVFIRLLKHLAQKPGVLEGLVDGLNEWMRSEWKKKKAGEPPQLDTRAVCEAVRNSVFGDTPLADDVYALLGDIVREARRSGDLKESYQVFPKWMQKTFEKRRARTVNNKPAKTVSGDLKDVKPDQAERQGGIDLTAANTPFKVRADGQISDLQINGPIEGLSSRITGMAPMTDLWGFLGITAVPQGR